MLSWNTSVWLSQSICTLSLGSKVFFPNWWWRWLIICLLSCLLAILPALDMVATLTAFIFTRCIIPSSLSPSLYVCSSFLLLYLAVQAALISILYVLILILKALSIHTPCLMKTPSDLFDCTFTKDQGVPFDLWFNVISSSDFFCLSQSIDSSTYLAVCLPLLQVDQCLYPFSFWRGQIILPLVLLYQYEVFCLVMEWTLLHWDYLQQYGCLCLLYLVALLV